MNICFVTQEFPPDTNWGGIATYYAETSLALKNNGHNVIVICRSIDNKDYHYTDNNGIHIYRICPPKIFTHIPYFSKRIQKMWDGYQLKIAVILNALTKTKKIDLIETPSINGETIFFQLIYPNFPVITRVHGLPHLVNKHNNLKFNMANKIKEILSIASIKKNHGISTVSKIMKRKLIRSMEYNKKVKVIYNSISIPENVNNNRRKIDILYVGRLELRKGTHIFIDSLKSIFQKSPNINVVIIGKDGTGPNGKSMSNYLYETVAHRDIDKITLKGQMPREQVLEFYKKSKLLVFPSVWEPFGYSIIEAMVNGVPVIATKCGGPEEIIIHGKTGILVNVHDSEGLGNQITELLNNPKTRNIFAVNALNIVNEKFDSKIIAQKIIKFYEGFIAK